MIVVGIDPGLTGAVAILGEDHLEAQPLRLVGEGKGRLLDGRWLSEYLGEEIADIAIIEKAQAMPKQGVATTFRYGMAYGQIISVVQSLGIECRLVAPQSWKRDLGLWGIDGDKDAALDLARLTFPRYVDLFKLKKDNHKAEAALLAHWWRRQQ